MGYLISIVIVGGNLINQLIRVPEEVQVIPEDGTEISLSTAMYISKNAGNNIPLNLSNQ